MDSPDIVPKWTEMVMELPANPIDAADNASVSMPDQS